MSVGTAGGQGLGVPAGAAPRRIVVPAPAKANLFLHVTGRRADGYHLLESLFVPLDWCDTIDITLRTDGRITRAHELAGVAEADDLSLRAALALRAATGTTGGATIGVVKAIPQGAGLGGGSSDAASVLIALNHLWGLGRSRAELATIGLTLGADVPFFLGAGPAVARGVGEALAPVTLPPTWLLVVQPDAQVPTKVIFAAPELTRSTPSAKIDVFSESYGRNDLEAVASLRYPAVASALRALRRLAPNARMTGSGACVFATFASEVEAQAARAQWPDDVPARVVRVLPRHPLAALA